MSNKRLFRSSNRILAGVCGGLAEYFDVDPTIVRIVFALVSLFSAAFPGAIVYLILMLIMPQQ